MNRNRVAIALLVVVALTAVLTPFAGVAAASGTPEDTAGNESKNASDAPREVAVSVESERWVEQTPKTVSKQSKTVHIVHGNYQEVRLKNINHSRVVEYGLSSEVGSLSYDQSDDAYVLDAQKTTGTYTLYWVVEKQKNVEKGNTTVTKTFSERVVAHVRVDSADTVHTSRESWRETQAAAQNWTEWVTAVKEVSDAETAADVKAEGQTGLTWIKFRNDPIGFLTGNIFALVIALAASAQGLILITLLIGIDLPALYRLARDKHRREMLDPEEMGLDEKRDSIRLHRIQQSLEGTTLGDVFSNPETANLVRRAFGADSLNSTLSQYLSLFTQNRLLRDRLSVMHHAGYRAATKRNAVEIMDAYILRPDDVDDDLPDKYEVEEMADPSDELADALRGDDVLSEINLQDLDAESSASVEPVEMDLEQLLKELDTDAPSSTAEQQRWGRYMVEMMEHTRKHPATDTEGHLRPMRLLINDLLKLMWSASDNHDIPIIRYHSEHLLYLLDQTSAEEDVDELVNRTQGGDFRPSREVESDD